MHTPGPWTLQYESGQFCYLNSPEGPVMRLRGGMMPTRHDARLLALAPEMAALLQELAGHADIGERAGLSRSEHLEAMSLAARALLSRLHASPASAS